MHEVFLGALKLPFDVIELQILSFVYQWSHRLLPPVSVNVSNLHPLFIPIQQGNRPTEIFI